MATIKPLLDILKSHGVAPHPVIDPNPTTSFKEWARRFIVNGWTVRSIEIPNFMSHFQQWDEEDQIRTQGNSDEFSHATYPRNEEDVVSFFAESYIWYMKKTYGRFPYVDFPRRHYCALPGAPDIYVDYAPRYRGKYVVVGEIKKPGVIWADEWTDPTTAGSETRALAGELFGYPILRGAVFESHTDTNLGTRSITIVRVFCASTLCTYC